MFKHMMIPVVASVWCLYPVAAAEHETAEARVLVVQRAAVVSSPVLQVRLHEAPNAARLQE